MKAKANKPVRRVTRAQRSIAIRELSKLSRGGWRNAKSCDWEPLEQVLRDSSKLLPPVQWGR